MAGESITACPHCGQRISSPAPTGACPGCSLPMSPTQDELQTRIDRLARQHKGAGDRLGLLQSEYGDLHRQLDRIASSLTENRERLDQQEDRDGERLQWESALAEERHRREQAEVAAAELRIVRAEDMERYLLDHQKPPDLATEQEQWRHLAEAALPLEARIRELEEENSALLAKVREAERSLLDAAGLVGQLTDLRNELERLGTRYLHAREEATRFLNEKLDLRAEIDELADQLLHKASQSRYGSEPTVQQARERIRAAMRQQDVPHRPIE